MRTSRPISVTLGEMQERVDARVRSGDYASASEVVRAGLRALDREETVLDNVLRVKVEQALADTRPALPADEVVAAVRARHAGRPKASGHDA